LSFVPGYNAGILLLCHHSGGFYYWFTLILHNTLSVVAFVGPETLPLHVAGAHGYYAREGLDVRYEAATGSIGQMVRLIDGDCDMVMTAIDNIIAYNLGRGGMPADPLYNLAAFLGCASEPRPLARLSGPDSYLDLSLYEGVMRSR